jgi:3-oxoacyl-[acyl-carrier protein] reductase
MDLGLKDKVAIVGGGSQGLGKGVALSLAREGVHVALVANDQQSLEETSNQIKAATDVSVLPLYANLSEVSSIESKVIQPVLDTFAQIDILFVNSGGPKPGSFFDTTTADWNNAYDSVLLYVVELYRQVIPVMQEQGWGRIINSTSLTVKQPGPGMILSNVFRSAVVSLAKSISTELIKDGITINNVLPGAFKTDRAIELMQDRSDRTGESLTEIEALAIANMPLGRYQTPDEYGDLVTYLASDSARGITGTSLQIDGGILKHIF